MLNTSMDIMHKKSDMVSAQKEGKERGVNFREKERERGEV